MFRRLGSAAERLPDIARVEKIIRRRFEVSKDEIILVSQDINTKPGFPKEETNIVFFKENIRFKIKIFLPVASVSEKDIPLKWLLTSLQDTGEEDCC